MPDWMLQLGGYLVGLGVLYGSIRADLKHAGQDAKAAHRRIDDHLGDHLRGDLCTANHRRES